MTVHSGLNVRDFEGCKAHRSGVVERVTLVMDVFGPHRRSAWLEEVADHTGLPRSTAFRLLRQLVELGWLERGPRVSGSEGSSRKSMGARWTTPTFVRRRPQC